MKLQWLKFDINFFDDEKIKVILDKPSGDAIILIWVRMLCLAMKSARPGLIEIRDGVPYDLDELAAAFGTKESILRTALQMFHRMGMIQVSEGSPIEIVNFLSWQNVEGIERQREFTRERVRKYREKLIGNGVGNALPLRNVTPCNDDRLDQIRSDQKREDKSKTKDVAPIGAPNGISEDGITLWTRLYEHRKKTGTLPASPGDKKNFYTTDKKTCDGIVKQVGLEAALKAFEAACVDKFWSKQPLEARNFPKYMALITGEALKHKADLEYYEKILRGEA